MPKVRVYGFIFGNVHLWFKYVAKVGLTNHQPMAIIPHCEVSRFEHREHTLMGGTPFLKAAKLAWDNQLNRLSCIMVCVSVHKGSQASYSVRFLWRSFGMTTSNKMKMLRSHFNTPQKWSIFAFLYFSCLGRGRKKERYLFCCCQGPLFGVKENICQKRTLV